MAVDSNMRTTCTATALDRKMLGMYVPLPWAKSSISCTAAALSQVKGGSSEPTRHCHFWTSDCCSGPLNFGGEGAGLPS